MMTFNTLSELKRYLIRDRGRRSFSPVRFINVDSLTDWVELKNFLSRSKAEIVPLSEFCTGADTFPNLRRLRSKLRRENRDVCIFPLAEILRVNPARAEREIESFMSLHEGELCTTRIYLLMYRLGSVFKSLKISDQRRRECVLLSRAERSEYSLTVVQKSMWCLAGSERVDGFKQYLLYWEQVPSDSLTLFTENAIYMDTERYFDDVKIIANTYDLLRQRYDLPAELRRSYGSEAQWRQLAELVIAVGNFERAFCCEFKVERFDTSVLENFAGRDKFHRWFLWLRCKVSGTGYVFRCGAASTTAEEFSRQVYELILTCTGEKNFDEQCRERRTVLSLMKILPQDEFLTRVRHLDKITALKVLTLNSRAERLLIFETLQRFRYGEFRSARKVLQQTLPALANYLSEAAEGYTSEQAEYFRRYRWLKVTNRLTDDFNRRVTNMARSKGFSVYALQSRNELVAEEYSAGAAIYFVDGLGAEYLSYFAAELSDVTEGYSIRYRVGRCNLPSITELNKDFLVGRNVVAEELTLDTLKHETRTYPENILSELNFLVTLKEKILRGLEVYGKIILCSDHGTSRLAVIARRGKFDNAVAADGRQVYKSGRYGDALSGDDKKFPVALEFDGKTIFADYSRFVQKGSVGNEVHGGATLEEVLVPVIVIERNGGARQ